MPQFDLPLCRIGRNVAHRVRRYIRLFVASELVCLCRNGRQVSDVEGLIPKRTHVASKNNKLIRRRWISAFLLEAS